MNRVKFLNSIFFLFSIIVVLYICSIGIKNIFRYNAFYREYRSLVKNLHRETLLRESYNSQFLHLGDNDFWEVAAKQRLGFIKKGEEVYKLIYR